MPAPERPARSPVRLDWRAWLLLAWVAWFGLLYARMIVERKRPEWLPAALRTTRGG